MKFQKISVTLQVSEFDSLGYWVGNKSEYVSAGTALGGEYTENVFVPSDETMTGKFDSVTGDWVEIKNKSLVTFFDSIAVPFHLDLPDGDFPEWAIFEKPPEFDRSVSYVERVGGEWVVSPFDKQDEPEPEIEPEPEPEIEPYVMSDSEKALDYLMATDFYVTRKLEKGTAIPKEVMTNRDKCREILVTDLPDTSFLNGGK